MINWQFETATFTLPGDGYLTTAQVGSPSGGNGVDRAAQVP
jgi:hypothetical protein